MGHYKVAPNKVEPIDLYKDGGMLRDFALASIIKYAYRNRQAINNNISVSDMEKIKHYADILVAIAENKPPGSNTGEIEVQRTFEDRRKSLVKDYYVGRKRSFIKVK